jgi:hypothetical protein
MHAFVEGVQDADQLLALRRLEHGSIIVDTEDHVRARMNAGRQDFYNPAL